MFVVGLHRVEFDVMLDPDSLNTLFERAGYLTLQIPMRRLTEESHDILGAE